MNRRSFLQRTALGSMATSMSAFGGRAGADPVLTEADKLRRIGVCSWSLHGYFPKTRPEDFKWPGKMLDLREYPELMADKYHIHNLELCSTHFGSTDPSYIKDLKAAIQKTHSRVTNMPVDYPADWQGTGLCNPDEKQWQWEIAERKKWIDIAAELSAQSIRPNPGGTTKMTDFSRPIAAYKALGDYGKSKGVKVLIENHGNVAGKAENIVAIIKGAGPKWVGAAPDFGNFPDADRYHGLELMFPYTSVVCHARYETPGGAEMNGKMIQFDFARCMKIAQTAGFKGVYSAEFAGDGDPYEGIQKILDQLVKYL